ncbi:MAG: NusG domain II-containing protein [Nitrospirae bacterium]|nr:NusG domain II-containing protein [Nitrospirota bacterium]
MRHNNITLADKVLLSICIFLSFYSFVYVKEAMPKGSEVRIEVDGKLKYTLPLNADRTVELSGVIGRTTIEIKRGKVRIKDAPCTNKICIHEGWIERGSIVCLPNKVVVTVSGPDKNKGPDAISG